MMQNSNAKNEIDRFISQRDIVCRRVEEVHVAHDVILEQALSRYVHDRLRYVHGDHFRLAPRQQDAALSGAATEIEHRLTANIAEQMMRILKRIDGVRRRV